MRVRVDNERALPPEGKSQNIWLYLFVYFGKIKGKYSPQPTAYYGFEYADEYDESRPDEKTGEIPPFLIGRTTYGKQITEFFVELAERDLTIEEKKHGFDIDEIIGGLFRAQVSHDMSKTGDKMYANIRTIRERYEEKNTIYSESTRRNNKLAFSIDYNPRTESRYMSAEELTKCPVFKRLPMWARNRVKDTVEFSRFDDAAKFPKEEND